MARRPRADRVRQLALPQLLPNLLTLGAICAGLTSLRFAIAGRFGEAVGLIILAAILDALDGRMARMMGSESAIGAELDSLADFLNFGVVTGMLIYLSMLSDIANVGWIAVLVYVVGCVLRLARFNVDARSPAPGPSLGGFIGVPSPAGAMLAMATTLAGEEARPAFIANIYGPLVPVAVPADAPPLFIALTADDGLFANSGFGLVESWRAAGRPVEFHFYEQGGHGFGMYPKTTTSTGWFDAYVRWLAMHGLLDRDGRATAAAD